MARNPAFLKGCKRIVAAQHFTFFRKPDQGWLLMGEPEPWGRGNWTCPLLLGRFSAPGYGATPLQALCLTLSRASIHLYARWTEPEFDDGRSAEAIPADWHFLDSAPYPFSLARFSVASRFAVTNGERRNPRVLAEETYRVTRFPRSQRRGRPMRAWIEAPRREPGGGWSCGFSVEAPLNVRGRGKGASSLLALFAGLAGLSKALYGSGEYKDGRLGREGDYGDSLIVPAVTEVLKDAPYPF
jgi:hypothetical protein